MQELEMVRGTAKGNSGILNYVDQDVQAVHEKFGIPYQASGAFTLIDALKNAPVGIKVVVFKNNVICYGYCEEPISNQKLHSIKRMKNVVAVDYYGKDFSHKTVWAE